MKPATSPRAVTLLYAGVALLALVGLADAVYLTAEHLAGRHAQCTILTGCATVLGSEYAMLAGLPLAGFGVVAYFTAFSFATLAAFGNGWARTLLVPTVAVMFLMTLWLLYVQAFVLEAFCEFCLLSAGVTTVLTVLVVVERVLNKRA